MALSLGTVSSTIHRVAKQLAWFVTNIADTATPVGGDVIVFYDASDSYNPKYGTLTQAASAGTLGNTTYLSLDIADGSAEATYFLLSPVAGTISKIYTVIDDVVSTADITLTGKIGSTAITNGVVTIATSSSAAGDIDVATPTAANTITAFAAMNFVVTAAARGGAPRIHVVVEITRS